MTIFNNIEPTYHPLESKYFDWVGHKIKCTDSQIIGIVGGLPGGGKSVRAMKWAYRVSGPMNIDQICFTRDEFIKAVLKYSKNTIIADEGISIFFGRAAMTKNGRLMAELINQIRQRNLHVIICIPFPETLDTMIKKMANNL